jgi:AcrR family transcriptional regulator
MPRDSDHKTGLNREGWLDLATEAMASQCRSKFSLDSLINAMPVSKGSFYWHFKNRAEFLFAIVDYWDRHHTQPIVDALEAYPPSVSAEEKLWKLMCTVYELKYNAFDFVIRTLTLEFPQLKQTVAAVDQKRYDKVRELFAEMGFEGDELETRTRSFVITTSMEQLLLVDIAPETEARQLKLRHEFFTRPVPEKTNLIAPTHAKSG